MVRATTEKLREDESYAAGLDALALHALIQSGLALNDAKPPALDLKNPKMLAKLETLMRFDPEKGRHSTYAFSLRAQALSLYLTHTPDADPKLGAKAPPSQFRKQVQDRLKVDAA